MNRGEFLEQLLTANYRNMNMELITEMATLRDQESCVFKETSGMEIWLPTWGQNRSICPSETSLQLSPSDSY
jgi:hypothetical protein